MVSIKAVVGPGKIHLLAVLSSKLLFLGYTSRLKIHPPPSSGHRLSPIVKVKVGHRLNPKQSWSRGDSESHTSRKSTKTRLKIYKLHFMINFIFHRVYYFVLIYVY